MARKREYLLAIKNVAAFGDTDIFPFPFENHIFHDAPEDVAKLLSRIGREFKKAAETRPPLVEHGMAAVGYTGFRWASQVDPLWNAFLLAEVTAIGKQIEDARVPSTSEVVFSYRFRPNRTSGSLFDKRFSWPQFQQKSIDYAQVSSYVLQTDIANFYPRIYHHRLDNALRRSAPNRVEVTRIMKVLAELAGGVSYGLPVGGPAARLLSELLLNRTDRLLLSRRIKFCRFADDYHIFADTREEAHNALVFLNEKLLDNEGLSLQKSKTRIMTSNEFLAHAGAAQRREQESSIEVQSRRFLSLRIHYDPYSPTADDDYERIANALIEFDIVGMLGRELDKSRIHQAMVRKLLAAIRVLSPADREVAIVSILESIESLYPVFPNVMRLFINLCGELWAPAPLAPS